LDSERGALTVLHDKTAPNAAQILLTAQLDERAALVCKLIRLAFVRACPKITSLRLRVAQKCYRQSNFQTLTQIIHGLQSPHVERLHRTWSRVGIWEMRVFEDLKAFTSLSGNFASLRRAMATLADEWGPPGQATPAPQRFVRSSLANSGGSKAPLPHGTIPFLGLFFRDLAVTNELPTYLDPTAPNTSASRSDDDTLAAHANPSAFADLPALPTDVPLRPLVNVHKHRTLAAVVQKILVFQEMAGLYAYEADPTLFRKCLAIRCVLRSSRTLCGARADASRIAVFLSKPCATARCNAKPDPGHLRSLHSPTLFSWIAPPHCIYITVACLLCIAGVASVYGMWDKRVQCNKAPLRVAAVHITSRPQPSAREVGTSSQ
jgi:hypothetical protein